MVIGAAGYKAEAFCHQAFCQCFAVGNNLFGVIFKFRFQRFAKSNGFRRDNVHQRAALHAGENSLVDLFCVLLLAED